MDRRIQAAVALTGVNGVPKGDMMPQQQAQPFT